MYIDRKAITEFKFHGIFFTVITKIPENGDLLEGIEDDGDLLVFENGSSSEGDISGGIDVLKGTSEETILLETKCDIQKAAKMFSNGTIMADYKVFFPCEVGEKLPIRFNSNFRCLDYAIPIQGRVVGLEYSQLGGCVVDIKMSEV